MGVRIRMEQNDHFMIMFDMLGNRMGIPFYFYIWYNKIVQEWNGKKVINYNNTFITKNDKLSI